MTPARSVRLPASRLRRAALFAALLALAMTIAGATLWVAGNGSRRVGSAGAQSDQSLFMVQSPVVRAGPRPNFDATFQLPAGARQGGPDWYILHLHATIETNADSPIGGWGVVSATTDGKTSVQAEIERYSDSLVRIRGVNLIQGGFDRYTHDRTFDIIIDNYIQLAGIRGGTNTFGVRANDDAANHLISAIVIRPDTAILRTRRAPPKLELSVSNERVTARPGQGTHVSFQVSPGNAWPLKGVRVSVVSDRSVSVNPQVPLHVETVPDVRPSSFDIASLQRGEHVIAVNAVSANGGGVSKTVTLTIK